MPHVYMMGMLIHPHTYDVHIAEPLRRKGFAGNIILQKYGIFKRKKRGKALEPSLFLRYSRYAFEQ